MRRNHRGERGAISFGTLFWTLLVGGAIYFAIMLAPVYFENYEVKQVLREVANAARRGEADESLREQILQKCKRVGSHYEIVDGVERTIPGLVLLSDSVFVRRDDSAKSIILQVKYTKHVNFPFTRRQHVMNFSPAVKGDLNPVTW